MVALLEVYVKRVPASPHLPAMVPPLLQALERAAKPSGTPALADRLQVRAACLPHIRSGCAHVLQTTHKSFL